MFGNEKESHNIHTELIFEYKDFFWICIDISR